MSWLQTQQPGVSHNRFENASRFQQRPQAPPDIVKRFLWRTEEGIDLVEAMENALPGFDERSVVEQGL